MGTPCLFTGRSCSGGQLQNTSCVLPFEPAIKQLFNFAPSKISLVTLLLQPKRVTRPRGETRNQLVVRIGISPVYLCNCQL